MRFVRVVLLLVLLAGCGGTAAASQRPVSVAPHRHAAPASSVTAPTTRPPFTAAEIFAIRIWTEPQFHHDFERRFVLPYNEAEWLRVHTCEQSETWHGTGKFGNGLPAGNNGLGFSRDAWRMAVQAAHERGATDVPFDAFLADPHHQMMAAEAFRQKFGGGPDCL